ncbi:hypothetical protein CEXT_584081 [Caerostris extrusa]|uniref:Ycf15 n=1 Tax=Caerostris extrusa TaxID=172846 RepID=A0AAV4SQZ7_CAEEX|nr:hypothetical protein CEXT_584081 [Caerostris extrusa]
MAQLLKEIHIWSSLAMKCLSINSVFLLFPSVVKHGWKDVKGTAIFFFSKHFLRRDASDIGFPNQINHSSLLWSNKSSSSIDACQRKNYRTCPAPPTLEPRFSASLRNSDSELQTEMFNGTEELD